MEVEDINHPVWAEAWKVAYGEGMTIYNLSAATFLRSCGDYHTIIADPPDGIGLKYNEYSDDWDAQSYTRWLAEIIHLAIRRCQVFWLSYNARWMHDVGPIIVPLVKEGYRARTFIWSFGFGQYQSKDSANCFRPILRLSSGGWRPTLDTVRVESTRQRMGDRRANPKGKIPGDVLAFSRIQGNNRERRSWHPTQHPEGLIEFLVKSSGGGPVLDPFLGSGTTMRVCKRLGVECDGVEIDSEYCRRVSEELDVPVKKTMFGIGT